MSAGEVEALAGEAGADIVAVALAVLAALVPLAVSFIMARWAFHWAVRVVSGGGGSWEGRGDYMWYDEGDEYGYRREFGGDRAAFDDWNADQNQLADEAERRGDDIWFDESGRLRSAPAGSRGDDF